MKKLTYLLAAAAVFAACNSGNNGYTVTGTIEGAADGDTVYLQTVEGRQLVKLDSAIIANRTFTFKGTQDTAANRYITYNPAGTEGMIMDFFLENGKINIKLNEKSSSATGTANNDIYQAIRIQLNELDSQMENIYASMADTALTDQQRESKKQRNGCPARQNDGSGQSRYQPKHNQCSRRTSAEKQLLLFGCKELDPLVSQIPATYSNDATVIRIKENVEKDEGYCREQRSLQILRCRLPKARP